MSQGVLTHQMAFSYLWNIFDEQKQLIQRTVISLLVAYDQKLALFSDPNVSVRLSVCWSVRLSVCPFVFLSVCPSVRFLGKWLRPLALGVRPGPPKKGVSAKSISSRGFGARGSSHTFSETGQWGEQNVGSGILIFGPWPEKSVPEGGAGREPTKILEFQYFF